MSRVAFVCSGTLCIALLAGCWEGVSRDVLSTLLSVDGEVVSSSKGSAEFYPANSQTKLSAGSILRTSKGARANLILIPGALVRLLERAELKIDELRLTKDGNETGDAVRERIARVELHRGGMVGRFKGIARFAIETPNAAINVLPDCLFCLDVNENRTRLTCIRGKVFANSKSGQSVSVDAGFVCEWPSKNPPLPAAEDKQAQTDTTAGLQVARELQDLAAAQRDRLPF